MKQIFITISKTNCYFLGWNISNKDEKKIINICRGKHIDLYMMKKTDSSYQLDYDTILEFNK